MNKIKQRLVNRVAEKRGLTADVAEQVVNDYMLICYGSVVATLCCVAGVKMHRTIRIYSGCPVLRIANADESHMSVAMFYTDKKGRIVKRMSGVFSKEATMNIAKRTSEIADALTDIQS